MSDPKSATPWFGPLIGEERIVRPIVHAGVLALAAAFVLAWPAPQAWTAAAIAGYNLAISAANPINGVFFAALVAPFALCEQSREYAWLYDVLVWTTVLCGARRGWLGESMKSRAGLALAAAYLFASAASLPLDAKEFIYDAWANDYNQIAGWFITAHAGPKTRYLRLLLNLAANVGLLFIAARCAKQHGAGPVMEFLQAYALVALAVSLAGVYFIGENLAAADSGLKNALGLAAAWARQSIIPAWDGGPSFLTMSLVGKMDYGAMAGFSYNTQFYAQWLLTAVPLLVGLGLSMADKSPWTRAMIFGTAAILAASAWQTGQRSMYLSLVLIATVYAAGWAWARGLVRAKTMGALAGAALLAAASFALWKALGFLGARAAEDLSSYLRDSTYFVTSRRIFEPRLFLWHTAAGMLLASPVLGVGLGRYSALFNDYFNGAYRDAADVYFAAGSAHSLYFEMLAEQGLAGFGLFAAAAALTGKKALENFTQESGSGGARHFHAVNGLALSCLVWLLLGASHDIRIVRSLDACFWIFTGMIWGLAPEGAKDWRVSFRALMKKTAWILIPALAFQFYQIWARPISRGYSAGFHNWEANEKGEAFRWMGKRAVFLPSGGAAEIRVKASAPIPGVKESPQKLSIKHGLQTREVTLTDNNWAEAVLTAERGKLAFIEADRIFNPQKEGASPDDRDLSAMVIIEEKTPGE